MSAVPVIQAVPAPRPWVVLNQAGPEAHALLAAAGLPIAEYVLTALLTHQRRWGTLRTTGEASWREIFAKVERAPPATLQGQTLGIAGYGAIGREVAKRAQALGMDVLALRRGGADVVPDTGVRAVASIEGLLGASDHVVLALPITPQTRHCINARSLAHAKPGLHLVNIARGALVDQPALLQALDSGRLSGATLDVTDPEPLPEGHALYHHPREHLTPHVSWAAEGSVALTAHKFLANLTRYVEGLPLEDVVDPARGY